MSDLRELKVPTPVDLLEGWVAERPLGRQGRFFRINCWTQSGQPEYEVELYEVHPPEIVSGPRPMISRTKPTLLHACTTALDAAKAGDWEYW